MDIRFNSDTSKFYDYFISLYISNNYDESERELKDMDIPIDKDHREFIKNILDKCNINREKLNFYFNKDFSIQGVFISFDEYFKYISIEEALENIAKLDGEILKKKLIENILLNKNDYNYGDELRAKAEDICKSDQLIFKLIKELDIDKDIKWNLSCFVDNPLEYRDEYVEIMRGYIPIFEEIYRKKSIIIEKFNDYIKKNINKSGMNFIKNKTRNMVKYESFNRIYITTSYIHYYGLRINIVKDSLFLCLGRNFEASIEKMAGEDTSEKEKHIGVFKNLSDKTRFEIIKLLGEEKQYFNREIADILGITGATVSYHMNYLMSAGIISIDKKNNRNIYNLNKSVVRDSIKFLESQLKL